MSAENPQFQYKWLTPEERRTMEGEKGNPWGKYAGMTHERFNEKLYEQYGDRDPYQSWTKLKGGVEDYKKASFADIQEGMSTDLAAMQEMAAAQNKAKADARDRYRDAIERMSEEDRASIEASKREGITGADDTLTQIRSDTETSYQNAMTNLQTNLTEMQAKFEETRTYTKGEVERVWEAGAEALSNFRNTTAEQMTTWNADSMTTHRDSKTSMAADLRKQDYREDEIETKLKQMDLQQAQAVGRKLADTKVGEENAYRTLEQGYIDIGARTSMEGAEVIQSTDWGEAQYTAGNEALQAGMDKWRGDTLKEAEIAALDTKSKFIIEAERLKTVVSGLELTGEGELARMYQDMEEAYIPTSSILIDMFALETTMRDRYLSIEGQTFGMTQEAGTGPQTALDPLLSM